MIMVMDFDSPLPCLQQFISDPYPQPENPLRLVVSCTFNINFVLSSHPQIYIYSSLFLARFELIFVRISRLPFLLRNLPSLSHVY